jgi:hypothetical protein
MAWTSRLLDREWRTWETAAFGACLAALFLLTAIFRFAHLASGFPNDHFLFLAGAQQMLLGDWPTRDFLDPGFPLMFGAAALAQLLLGKTLYAEAVLVSLSFALAAVFTALAVRELTGSRVLALLAALLEIAIVPRTYGYPKLLAYAAAVFLLQRYVSRPTKGRLFALAASIVTAFLFRHDHGVYLGIAGALAAWLAPPPGPWTARLRRSATLVGLVVLLAAPYLVYVQANGGVWAYLQTGLEFRAAELRRQELAWPESFDEPLQALMIYEYWAIPVSAWLLLFVRRRREDAGTTVARLAPILTVALLVNWTFLRSPFHTRLPDAIVPAVVAGSWLLACAWRARHPWFWRPVSVLLLAAVASSVLSVGRIDEELDRTGLLDEGISWRETLGATRSALQARHAEGQLPSRAAVALVPFYAYVDRCTRPEHRLLAVGNIAELPVFARRAFAGGQIAFLGGYYDSEAYQRLTLRRLAQQVVPLVLIPGEAYAGDFARGFPLLAAYVNGRYVPLGTYGEDAGTSIQVLFDSTLPVSARDAETGWPCLK